MVDGKMLLLIEKYFEGTASDEEKATLMAWYRSVQNAPTEIWVKDVEEKEQIRLDMLEEIRKLIAATKQQESGRRPAYYHNNKFRKWGWVAAAGIFFLVAGSYFLFSENAGRNESVVNSLMNGHVDLSPGRDGAILTTSSGEKIILDTVANGSLGTQANVEVIKHGTQLTYQQEENAETTK